MPDPKPHSAADITASIAAIRQLLAYPRAVRPAKIGLRVPGNILLLPPRETYVVGDLHANVENLRSVIAYSESHELFRNANVLLLGDVLHSATKPSDSAASLDTLMMVFDLLLRHPEHVYWLRGNHETINDSIVKSGLEVSRYFNDFIRREYGQPMLFELGKVFNQLPLIALGENLVACHAGPACGDVTYESLLNAALNDAPYQQLLNSRSYSARDVAVFIKALNRHPYTYGADTLFVVGHHALEGERSIQQEFRGIASHFALQSYHPQGLSLLRVTRDSWEVIELQGS
jgi:hypothetical protein